jgi:dCMP deaminase
MNRPDWDLYFMSMADLASTRSVCLRAKVGAVIAKDNQILATGYNGPPRGVPHCHNKIPEVCSICNGTGYCDYLGGRKECFFCKGYGETPPGIYRCIRSALNIPSGEQIEKCRGGHAEQNAIVQAARHGISVKGAKIYCNYKPCITCLKLLINAGITEIIYSKEYNDPMVDTMAKDAGMRLRRME